MDKSIQNYFKNVLGVSQVLQESLFDNQNVNIVQSQSEVLFPKLFVFVENLNEYNEDEKKLLLKMIQALQIPMEKIEIHDEDQMLNLDSKVKVSVYFCFKNTINLRANEIYSPQVLLKNPNLKLEAWDFLKKVISKFKNIN